MTTETHDVEVRRCANCEDDLTIGPGIVVIVCPLCGSRAIGTSESEWTQ